MRRSLLIVDDDDRILTSLSEALADGSTEIRTAESAEEALARIADGPAGVVLADVKMPGMSGIELLRLLGERTTPAMIAIRNLSTVYL